jgi:hypothetical protein
MTVIAMHAVCGLPHARHGNSSCRHRPSIHPLHRRGWLGSGAASSRGSMYSPASACNPGVWHQAPDDARTGHASSAADRCHDSGAYGVRGPTNHARRRG